jgi:UMF1 family MFS transporter
MYDWANSAYAAVISTFVFSTYFTKAVASDPISGTEMWGYAISASSFCVAVSAPILGAIADRAGRRKPWIFVFTLGLVVSTAMLWFAEPDPSSVVWALTFAAAANFTFEMATVFYNAMLPDVAGRDRIGRVSGWAWGLGYVGGIVCLILLLVGFVQPEVPWLGLDKGAAEHVRVSAPFVALWLALFSLPLFLFTPDIPATGVPVGRAVRDGLGTLIGTLREARKYKGIIAFLVGYMIYIDGLGTMFTFGGIYAAGTFGMEQAEVIQLGIGMSLTAGAGAFAMAWVDDWIGPKRTILISLIGLIVFGAVIVSVTDKTLFWVFALGLGLFVGPGQAAGRSMMAHLAPDHLRTEMFGFMALAGKATAFVGPAAVAWATAMAGSQRHGMATVLAFFVVGFILILRVPDARR